MLRLVLIALGAVGCLGESEVGPLPSRPPYAPPYLVEMEVFSQSDNRYHHHCDGSVVSENYALTAAFCADGVTLYLTQLRHHNEISGVGGSVHALEKIVVHEHYNPESFDYNVAVIKVQQSFYPKCVIGLSPSTPSPGSMVTSCGFGHVNPRPHGLVGRQTYPVLDHGSCNTITGNITDRILCAGHLQGKQRPCGGDIGGPLVFENALVGVVATKQCGSEKENMGLFADVANLHEWISTKIRPTGDTGSISPLPFP